MQQDTILVVDDVEVNRAILSEMFKNQYRILEACDGAEAIEIIKQEANSIVVILLDIIMPNVDGYGVLDYLTEYYYMEKIPVIIISGDNTTNVEVKGFDYGVSDVISKPFDTKIVMKRVDNVIDLFRNKNNLEKIVQENLEEIEYQTQRLRELTGQVIDTLSSVIEFRDNHLGSHVVNVKLFTKILLKYLSTEFPEYGLNKQKVDMIVRASVIHDIGKISIPDSILFKNDKLSSEEYEMAKAHTQLGVKLLNTIPYIQDKEFLECCKEVVIGHHEMYDGSGYPYGKKGDEIPISAQVVSLANRYDHLIGERIYKGAIPKEQAYEMIVNHEAGCFNDNLIACFKMAREEFEKVADGTLAECDI